jgi:outer membrane protein assembly factor BamB
MGKTGEGSKILCLSTETGKEIWSYRFERRREPQSTPTTDGSFVYALDKKGILVCLNARNGKLKWKRDLVADYDVVKPFYDFAASPIIESDLVIMTANSSGIALNKETGEKVWDSERPPKKIRAYWANIAKGTDYSTPVFYDHEGKRFAAIFSYRGLHSVETKTGDVLWLYEWSKLYSGRHITDPLIFDNKIFITDFSYRNEEFECILLDIEGGTPNVIWERQSLGSEITTPVFIDGYIYGGHGGPDMGYISLRCLDSKTGEVMWEEDLGKRPREREMLSISAAGGKLIILEEDGMLHIAEADPSAYHPISSCQLPSEKGFHRWWTHPVLYDSRIYCRNYIGDLVCIDLGKQS